MDSLSLSDALHLQLHGVDVPGTVTGILVGGVILGGEFVPTSPLEPASPYELSVSTAARDLSGIPLSTPVQLTFTTAGTTAGPTPPDSAKPNPPDPPITAWISAISPTSAPAGSPPLTLTITGANFGGTSHNQSYAVWSANGRDTPLATTFVNSTHLTALIPTALLTNPARSRCFCILGIRRTASRTGCPTSSFSSHGPTAAAGNRHDNRVRSDQHTLPTLPRAVAVQRLSRRLTRRLPVADPVRRWLVTYSPVTPGTHRLLLSNPCTATHEPSAEDVSAAADESVTVEVYIPPDCE